MVVVDGEWVRIWMEAVVVYLRIPARHSAEGTKVNVNYDSQQPCLALNMVPHEYKFGPLLLHQEWKCVFQFGIHWVSEA
jgi:hypothetical protein